MGPGPDRALSTTTTVNLTYLIAGAMLVFADLAFYGVALFVLAANILAPADGFSRDFDGASSAYLVVPALSVSSGLAMDLAYFDHLLVLFLLTVSTAP